MVKINTRMIGKMTTENKERKLIASWIYHELDELRKNAKSTTERQVEHLTYRIMDFIRDHKDAI